LPVRFIANDPGLRGWEWIFFVHWLRPARGVRVFCVAADLRPRAASPTGSNPLKIRQENGNYVFAALRHKGVIVSANPPNYCEH
jgi:hypothetical protein